MLKRATLAVSCIALLALGACSSNSNSSMAQRPAPMAMPAPPPPPPPPPMASYDNLSDQDFINQAASAGMAEVGMGKMARQKGSSPAVRRFGMHMVTDHSKANNRLMAIAHRMKMDPMGGMTPDQQAMADQLAAASGPDFDRMYIDGQVKAHQDTVALFDAEAKNGQSPQLKRFAKSTLPTLRMHLRQIQSLAGKMS